MVGFLPATELHGGAAQPTVPVRIETGEIAGAKFTIARPASWNGRLLIIARGLRPVDAPLSASLDPQQFRIRTLVERGWMVAKTSFRRNGVIVADAIADLDALRAHVARTHGQPLRVILEGEDLGGLIATLIAERDPQMQPNGAPDYAGVVAVGPSLDLREAQMTLGLSLRPRRPLIFLVNQNELDGPRRYIASPAMATGDIVPPLLQVIARDGHLNIGQRERLAAIEAMETWLNVGRDALPRAATGAFFNATLAAEPGVSRAKPLAEGRGFEAQVTLVTPTSGTVEVAATAADFEAAGILPMSWFQLRVGERTFRTRFGRDPNSVERGEWVAYLDADGATWIARVPGNAAASAGVEVGGVVTLQRY